MAEAQVREVRSWWCRLWHGEPMFGLARGRFVLRCERCGQTWRLVPNPVVAQSCTESSRRPIRDLTAGIGF